jgi:AcrR family transcriptional regulator
MEEAILEKATSLFLEKGFEATSTSEIASSVGCNQALVHYYYRTKERLFERIFQKKIKFLLGSLLKVGKVDMPYTEKLSRQIESHFEAIRQQPSLPLFFLRELAMNPERLKAVRETLGELPHEAIKQMNNELQEEIKKGTVRPITIYDLLMTIVSLNIMAFLGEPIFKTVSGISDEEYQSLLERRKKENIHIVLKSLEP